MAHEIETAVFSVREGAGWTGLGQAIPADMATNPRAIAEICRATYEVKKEDLFLRNPVTKQEERVPDHQALIRSDTGEVLHVASRNRYHVSNRQPVEIFEAFRDELAKEHLEISHAAVLRGGRLIAVSALLTDDAVTPSDGHKVCNYVTLSTGYDGSHGTSATLNSIRVVCANTWRANLESAKAAGKAKSISAATRMAETTLPELVANIDLIVSEQRRTYDALANAKLDPAEVLRLFADTCGIIVEDLGRTDKEGKPVVSTKARNMLDALRASYTNAPGAVQGTAWGAFQAVTHFASHVRTVRDTAGDGSNAARVNSNLFGDSARMKAVALDRLTRQYAMAA
jgi:phage/plasmid-like protein (TIGR03299 family)